MRLLASALVIVGDGFAPPLILWPEALTNEIATTSVNGSSHPFIGHFIMLQCYCTTGNESTLPWLFGNVGTDQTYPAFSKRCATGDLLFQLPNPLLQELALWFLLG